MDNIHLIILNIAEKNWVLNNAYCLLEKAVKKIIYLLFIEKEILKQIKRNV